MSYLLKVYCALLTLNCNYLFIEVMCIIYYVTNKKRFAHWKCMQTVFTILWGPSEQKLDFICIFFNLLNEQLVEMFTDLINGWIWFFFKEREWSYPSSLNRGPCRNVGHYDLDGMRMPKLIMWKMTFGLSTKN